MAIKRPAYRDPTRIELVSVRSPTLLRKVYERYHLQPKLWNRMCRINPLLRSIKQDKNDS